MAAKYQLRSPAVFGDVSPRPSASDGQWAPCGVTPARLKNSKTTKLGGRFTPYNSDKRPSEAKARREPPSDIPATSSLPLSCPQHQCLVRGDSDTTVAAGASFTSASSSPTLSGASRSSSPTKLPSLAQFDATIKALCSKNRPMTIRDGTQSAPSASLPNQAASLSQLPPGSPRQFLGIVEFSKHQHHALYASSAQPSALVDGQWELAACIEAAVRFPSGSKIIAQPRLDVTQKTHRLWRERPHTRTKAKEYTSETQVAESLPTNLQRTYWALVERIYEDIANNSGGPHTWVCGLSYRIEAGNMYEHTCTYRTTLHDTHYLNHILAEHGIAYNPDWQIICHWVGLESTTCSPASLVKHLREKYLAHAAPISSSHQGRTLYADRRTMQTSPRCIHGYSFPAFTYRQEPSRRETMMRHMRPQIVDWFKYLVGEYEWPKWAGKAPEGDRSV